LEETAEVIMAEVVNVGRVLYDLTPVPPGEVEWM
jgi:GMP synthase PP-ATPase subunit